MHVHVGRDDRWNQIALVTEESPSAIDEYEDDENGENVSQWRIHGYFVMTLARSCPTIKVTSLCGGDDAVTGDPTTGIFANA